MTTPTFKTVAVIGAGAMGRGIAQIATQSGSQVLLYDTNPAAVQQARESIVGQWDKMGSKGKLTPEQVEANKQRLQAASELGALKDCDLVIEAIIERLDIKKSLFDDLEGIVATNAVLVTNTSSLSVTAIANGAKHPERIAGYHFFNPVPLMKVVEVIAGLETAPDVCDRLMAYAKEMGHTGVVASDTPGFIVNHAGRGYGTEALRLLGESVTDVVTIDRVLRDQVGFKMGPFELFDLTGLDVSHFVMESIYKQYYDEARYRPSALAAQRVAGGVFGRKVGKGFYDYPNGQQQVPAEAPAPQVASIPPVWVSTHAARRAELLQLLKDLGATIETGQSPSPEALTIVAPLGLDVTTVTVLERLDPARTVGIDMLVEDGATKRRVIATNPATRTDMRDAAHALFAKDGKPVSVIRDSGGFITQRVVANIVNIAADICQQRVCSPQDLETAVTLGLGYPVGPLALGDKLGAANILEVLMNLQLVYGDQRYRPSPWLRRRAAIGLSLMHQES
jgi:3-hydroxybutyryl-CoA dehydrogenase